MGMTNMQKWMEEVLESNKNLFLCFPLCMNPIRVVEQGNYQVIVYHMYSGVQHPMISMMFIP